MKHPEVNRQLMKYLNTLFISELTQIKGPDAGIEPWLSNQVH